MKQYVIVYNEIDNPDTLKVSQETISGRNAKDALYKRFNRKFKRLLVNVAERAEVILVEGYADGSGHIQHTGDGRSVAYKAISK